MFNFRIDVSDATSALARLSDREIAQRIAAAVADEKLIPRWSQYPQPSRKKQPFKSDKQRRFVHALARRGGIPYRRTGEIGKNSNWSRAQVDDGLVMTNNARAVDLVRVKGKQAKYHQGTWPTDEDIARAIENDDAETIGTAVIIQMLQEAGVS